MAVTMRHLVSVPELGLRPVAGHAGLDGEVTWVHGSEVPDPTPWLTGGELLLTTGVRLTEPGELAQLCTRLAGTGAAGIGFATGVAFAEIPMELRERADQHGLPVVEVPYETPFVAIAKELANELATQRNEALRRALHSHRRLIDAALTSGGTTGANAGVVGELASLLAGWCVVFDTAGEVLASAPETASHTTIPDSAELTRLRAGEIDSMGIAGPHGYLVGHRLGAGDRGRGLLISGRPTPFGPPEHAIVAAAVSLLGLGLEQAGAAAAQAHRARNELVVQLLHDGVETELANRQLADWGLRPDQLRVAAIAEPSTVDDEELREIVARSGVTAVVAAEHGGQLHLLGNELDPALAELPAENLGLSEPAAVGELDFARRQAIQAARIGKGEGKAITRAQELRAMQLLRNLRADESLDVFIARILEPLGTDTTLIESLRAFLDAHGSWHQAARQLGIHRHTLRARLTRAQQLLDRNLDSPYVRLELSLALHAHELLG
ncbi:purine catabolism regulator [Tamaricihabitans halophyticus]|uniref:Purine catabolism regulator n=1 Tax=Tamaricihabitans halophyticus TaxID=1262583 RepID=A0A4R2QF02_9PSEU|nr:PucR family transcriptional regulator [Tamaricihabitans halophyticus]TCP47239.1 purine catabolism regulator [Tamaricihabitans halophyticus]